MEVAGTRFTVHNVAASFDRTEDVQEYVQLPAPPHTKIWKEAGNEDIVNAPMLLTTVRYPFMAAEVTVAVDLELDFDQAGLVIFAGGIPRSNPTAPHHHRRPPFPFNTFTEYSTSKWVKASLELNAGEPGISTTVANPSCGPDWSHNTIIPCDGGTMQRLRIKLEKVNDDLWVWYRIPEPSAVAYEWRTPGEVCMEWTKVREVFGFFHGIDAKSGAVTVGCYVARPMPLEEDEGKNVLIGDFEDLAIL